jgi:hypothetical protein
MRAKLVSNSPTVGHYVGVLVDTLLPADPQYRRQMAPGVFRSLLAAARLLVEKLIGRLASTCKAVWRQAVAMIRDLGPAVVPVLASKLRRARTEEGLLCVVALLGAVGRVTSPAVRGEIQRNLLLALRRARNEKVAAAISEVQEQLRRVGAGR